METHKEFEIGPIRPPSEADSLLLRITRNCPWNKCKFCTLYRKHQFTVRSVEDIKADIDQVAEYRQNILDGIPENLYELPEETAQRYFHIMHWIRAGEESVFLQDANTVVLTYDKLHEILTHLRKALPHIKRVTTYGRADSLNKFTVEELRRLKEAGLDRIHSGYESGSDEVLKLISKGYTKAMEIEAGQKIKASGIELSIYFMNGVGGKALSDSNAIETADVINKVNPDFVRIRTFVSQRGTEIYDEIKAGLIKECTDKEKALELQKMIEHIDGANGYLISDHIINLFEDVTGNIGTDKEEMLSIFARFENLNPENQRRYQLARRMGMVRTLDHMPRLSPEQKATVEDYLMRLDTEAEFEAFLLRLLRRYV
ncbi:MAG: radical SAM protein [Oscillospiraceae bacterium]|nr:radical SAM protein [Oscillospiraceae bacterium]